MHDRLPQGPSARLRGLTACTPHNPTDVLGGVTCATGDLVLDATDVTGQRHLELGFVVIGGNHDIASLASFRVETVVVKDPPADRIVPWIHLGQPTHLPTGVIDQHHQHDANRLLGQPRRPKAGCAKLQPQGVSRHPRLECAAAAGRLSSARCAAIQDVEGFSSRREPVIAR